jgi:alkyl hydroperoxide reductase subunit AhpC
VNYKKYRDQDFEILSVSCDNVKTWWLKAMQKDQMIWESVWDANKSVTKYTYLVSALPTNYLINKQGTIIAKNLKGAALTNKLKEVLGEN